MTNLYDNNYAKYTMEIITNEWSDLEKWSAYNEDKFLDEIAKTKIIIDVLFKKIKEDL
jgi:hypothetical protein